MFEVRVARVGRCAALAGLIILLANSGLQTAVANGDTRTISLHHVHTNDDITITYKRDGRYDEDALKKLDWFLRDWRKDENVHMDPRLFDLVWEVSREVGGDKIVHVVCGYRSPGTNEMLRHRSSGVAQFSQHMLGKAMDFYIPGASLEALRIAGLKMQRGGVGYYPTSGSPFVHLDVGGVRHWPRMSHDELARVFPDGRTVHIPSDGRPLSGYALAMADIEKRGGGASQSAPTASHTGSGTGGTTIKSLLASLFGKELDKEDDEESEPAPPVKSASATPRRGVFTVAAAESRPEPARTAVPQALPIPRPPAPIPDVSDQDTTASMVRRPARPADNDHVPLDILLAYAAQPSERSGASTPRVEPMGETIVRATYGASTRGSTRDGTSASSKKPVPAAVEVDRNAGAAKLAVPVYPGMKYDDPWLRAMILVPRLSDSMTAMFYGEPDFTALRTLMNKPTIRVTTSFGPDAYPGLLADRFSGEAVVFLAPSGTSRRSAALH